MSQSSLGIWWTNYRLYPGFSLKWNSAPLCPLWPGISRSAHLSQDSQFCFRLCFLLDNLVCFILHSWKKNTINPLKLCSKERNWIACFHEMWLHYYKGLNCCSDKLQPILTSNIFKIFIKRIFFLNSVSSMLSVGLNQ